MGFYEERIVPWFVELACKAPELHPFRQRATQRLHGRVLEIGFGSGLNVPHYPTTFTEVVAVEPSQKARDIARKRVHASPCPVSFVGLDAQQLPLDAGSVDSVLCTFSLCTIPDAATALSEAHRVLRPGGRFAFVEHGRASESGTARWQDRLNGIQRRMCGGCNLNRDIPGLIREAGFDIEELDEGHMAQGPKTHTYVYAGVGLRA